MRSRTQRKTSTCLGSFPNSGVAVRGEASATRGIRSIRLGPQANHGPAAGSDVSFTLPKEAAREHANRARLWHGFLRPQTKHRAISGIDVSASDAIGDQGAPRGVVGAASAPGRPLMAEINGVFRVAPAHFLDCRHQSDLWGKRSDRPRPERLDSDAILALGARRGVACASGCI